MRSNEINALISLVEDPDPSIFSHVKKELTSYGENVIPQLEMYSEANFYSELFQLRIEELIRSIKYETVQEGLKEWKNTEDCDLQEGLILLNKYFDPSLDEMELNRSIARIRQDIWLELNDSLTAMEIVKVFNHIIYTVYGLKGNKTNHIAPQNSYLSEVLKTKRGNSLSLAAIYRVLANSLDVPIYGINLPNHFLLAYVDVNSVNELHEDQEMENTDILFYINPFNGGSMIHRDEIDEYLMYLNLPKKVSYYRPCNNEAFINRMINNLIFSYTQYENEERVEELKNLQKIFETRKNK